MKKYIIIILILSSFIVACDNEADVWYKVTNNSDKTLNVYIKGHLYDNDIDTNILINTNETKYIYKTFVRTGARRKFDGGDNFMNRIIDTLGISTANNKICKDYTKRENWEYSFDKSNGRPGKNTYWLTIDNNDICNK